MKEETLIEQLKLKNTAVFSELIDTYQQKVFGTCISFIPNKEDAEDVAQEVFLEVIIFPILGMITIFLINRIVKKIKKMLGVKKNKTVEELREIIDNANEELKKYEND